MIVWKLLWVLGSSHVQFIAADTWSQAQVAGPNFDFNVDLASLIKSNLTPTSLCYPVRRSLITSVFEKCAYLLLIRMISPIRTDKSQFHPYFSSFIPEYSQPKRSSRTEELLPSNKPPLEFERQDFLEIAARGPQTLDEFDEKIAATRQLLDFLVSERDQAASNISDAKSLLYPVRRLPDDVLRAVFQACTESPDQAFNINGGFVLLEPEIDIESVQPNQSPWTVSCVCQQWRNVAIHTGELWSFVKIDLDNRPEDEELAKNRVFRLGLSLFRSNGHDLSIRLYGEKSVPGVCPILQILLPTAPYWKKLSVFLPLASFNHFSVCKGYLNRLDTLYIGGVESEIQVDAFHIDAFQLAPSLRVVGTYAAISRMPTPFCVPSSGVMTFISGGPNIHTYRSLKRFPRVQKLTLFCWAPIDEAAEPISLHSVTLLHLFHLPVSGALSVANMYSHLILPSLRHLEISFVEPDSPDEISFPVVTNPDSCPIKTLFIDLYRLSQEACTQLGDELIKFLRRTPKLNELYVKADSETELPGRWVNSLVYIPGQDAIVPRLCFLGMPDGRISAGDLGCLVGVIESRRRKDIDSSDSNHCVLLEEVELGPEPVEFDDEELSERWSALLAGGLIVTYREE
ncbi:uncharacterized protein ARMOST_15100 [Armillaria ostoyae]|uniref:F-box domain-containing protein n=1 Tax=Armillaria ostoyae TaxID=47428 RepID=A0A284RSG0_ARMOS|nr:uncharacterized protein ARMOST_15100 [Armillaria ostoyae]